MKNRCEICSRNFNSEDSLNQHNLSKHYTKQKKANINFRKYFIFIAIILIIILSVLSISSYLKKPGEFDDFAKCLTEKGAVVYGNDYCQYTGIQLNFFGKSKEYLNYVKCTNNKVLCNSKGVELTPTWEIKGEMYPEIQTFEKLSALTGCQL